MQDNNQPKQEVQQSLYQSIEKFKSLNTVKKLTIISSMFGMVAVMIFIIFFTGTSSKEKPQKDTSTAKPFIDTPPPVQTKNIYSEQTESEEKVISQIENNISNLKPPTPPVLDKIEITPPAPPAVITLPVKTETHIKEPQLPLPISQINQKKADTSQKPLISSTSVMAFGGASKESVNDTQKKSHETFLGFDGGTIDNQTLQSSSTQTIVATKINNDLKHSILQGKVIDGVLETAINTQLDSGIIRAVVSRDVYGEQGDLILIPKGSRLVGRYGASSSGSGSKVMTRVYASWNRIITPSGIDLSLGDTPSSDALGRNGVPGYLDTNLSNNLLNAFLVSVLGPFIIGEVTNTNKKNTTTTSTVDPKTGESSWYTNSNFRNTTIPKHC